MMNLSFKLVMHRAKIDCLLIIAAAVLPTVFHLPQLGFYSDDWAFLAQLHLARDQSFLGLLRELLYLDNAVRPIQWIFLTALYKLFGLHPLDYHIFNTMLVALTAISFYLCLRQLHEPPIFVLAVPLLYALLPHYSTDRLWISAMQANVSACFFFMSFYADERAIWSSRTYWWWNALGVALVLLSGLAYEVFMPLVIVGSCVLTLRQWWQSFREGYRRRPPWRGLIVLGSNGVAVVSLLIIKALLASRGVREGTPLAYLDLVHRQMLAAVEISYLHHVLKIPFTVWQIIVHYATFREVIMGVIIGVFLIGCISHADEAALTVTSIQPARMLVYSGLGVIVFAAGFSLYPPTPTMAGINNRAANAAAVGVALSLVGATGWIACQLSANRTLRARLFAAGIAILGVSGFFTCNTVAAFWVESYHRQLKILGSIKEQFPTMPAGTSLMLDGTCPYYGPAIVFDTSWDLAGALQLTYGHRDIRADVLHSRVRADKRGLVVISYDTGELYPYERLFVYHFGLRKAYFLRDAAAVQTYLTDTKPAALKECPAGQHGAGAEIPGMSLHSVVGAMLRRPRSE